MQPIRNLGNEYTAKLIDRHMETTIADQLKEGLKWIDLMWPLKMCEIMATTAAKLDANVNNYIQKWLGLPRCPFDAALFGRNAL